MTHIERKGLQLSRRSFLAGSALHFFGVLFYVIPAAR